MPQILTRDEVERLIRAGRAALPERPKPPAVDPLAAALHELARAIGDGHAAQHKALAEAMRANQDVADAIYALLERKERWRARVTRRDSDNNIQELIFEQLP